MIHLVNDGPRLLRTSYWQTEHAARGYLYLSINAGAFRLLVPAPLEAHDGSPNPYAVHLVTQQVDRLPADHDRGSRWICTVWTAGEDGESAIEALSLPATYRRSKRLPDLRPAAPSEGH